MDPIYTIVEGATAASVSVMVRDLQKAGWVCQGGVSISPLPGVADGQLWFAQALVKGYVQQVQVQPGYNRG